MNKYVVEGKDKQLIIDIMLNLVSWIFDGVYSIKNVRTDPIN